MMKNESPRLPSRWIRTGLLTLGTLLVLAGRALALTVSLHQTHGNAVSPKVDFEVVSTTMQHNSARQYLRIANTDTTPVTVRIYTNNPNWGGTEADRSGLVQSVSQNSRMPMYWKHSYTLAAQPFSAANESSWRALVDLNNPDFAQQRNSQLLQLNPNSVSYVYLGAKIPSGASAGSYRTRIVVETADTPLPAKTMAVSDLACKKAVVAKAVQMKAVVENPVEVKSVTLKYRLAGEVAYRSQAMTLTRSAWSAVQWVAETWIPASVLKAGGLEYYYETSDGTQTGTFGTAAAPQRLEVFNEFAEVPVGISPAAGKALFLDQSCAAGARAPELTLLPGSVDRSIQVSARKLDSAALPPYAGTPALAAYEFSPSGLQFNRPVTLSLPYTDNDKDGVVDGTNMQVASLGVYWFDGITWRNLGGTPDPATQTVNATISHFSTYALFPASALGPDQVRPAESIITPNSDGINDFAQFGISGDFTIHIFDMQARRVRKLEGVNSWDGRDDSGSPVESGVYLYQVRSDRFNLSGQIGVAR